MYQHIILHLPPQSQFYTQFWWLVDPKAQDNNSCGRMLARLSLHLGENLVGSHRLLPKPKKSLTKGPSVLGCQGAVLDFQILWIWDKYPDCRPANHAGFVVALTSEALKMSFSATTLLLRGAGQQEWGVLRQSPVFRLSSLGAPGRPRQLTWPGPNCSLPFSSHLECSPPGENGMSPSPGWHYYCMPISQKVICGVVSKEG